MANNEQLEQDALLNLLGQKQTPVDDRPREVFDQSYLDGSAAGQDMSWMLQPGATTGVGHSPDIQNRSNTQPATQTDPLSASGTMPIGGSKQYAPGSIMDMTGGQNSGVVTPKSEFAIGETDPTALGPKTPAASPVTASVFQGFTPKHAMEGFDFNREQNTGKSAKDAFAYLANQAPQPPLNDKAALQAWTEQYIVPGMKALGHDVSNVQGDKFHLRNWQGQYDVDYGRGAGADGGALAWQAEDAMSSPEERAHFQSSINAEKNAQTDAGGDSAMDRVMAEIAALQGGQPSPMDANALMELLQV